MMFTELFAAMHEALDDLMREFDGCDDASRKERDEQLAVLKSMSDQCLEEWLRFEEKLAQCAANFSLQPAPPSAPKTSGASDGVWDQFSKGQGYYKLYMFDLAVRQFLELVKRHPDFLLGRIYLAMGYLRLGNYGEAYRHLQFAAPFAEDAKLKAVVYQAMGCIQVQNRNMEKAHDYFAKAGLNVQSTLELAQSAAKAPSGTPEEQASPSPLDLF